MVIGEFEVSANTGGWQSRGTVEGFPHPSG
jgi:hypothetical protein